jgi:hypothetical protein
MLQAHSLLWSYLWVAPNLFLLVLSLVVWKKGLQAWVPAFAAFGLVSALTELSLFAADLIPSIGPREFWIADSFGLVIEGLVKFILIGEVFAFILRPYASLAKLGRYMVRWGGVVAVMVAAVAAAFTPKDGLFSVVASAHLLQQSIFIIESGLLVLVLGTAFYFHLSLDRPTFGLTLGLGISSCVHLGTWAVMASGGLPGKRDLLDMLNMATYHVCVMLWIYYLVFAKAEDTTRAPRPGTPAPLDSNLDGWNRELERLLHQRPLQQ